MKKTYQMLILLLLHSSLLFAQGNAISISSFTVKNQLRQDPKGWGPGDIFLVAANNTWGDKPVHLVLAIMQGGRKICGFEDGFALSYFKQAALQTFELLGGLANCETLPPGNYTLCARLIGQDNNRQWINISAEVCKPFTVGGGSSDNQKYEEPSIVFPPNNKVFTEQEANGTIVLRWTPVIPKPQEPVIYHFSIWKVEKGETPMHAMTGQPVVEKSVENLTQTNITSGLFPCPNCQFVYSVQATDKEGHPYGKNAGRSEPSSFNTNSEPIVQNKATNIIPSRINPCVPGGPSWNFGGNNFTAQPHPAGITQADVGTCDDVDFILKSNGNAKIWLKGTAGNEYIGVGTEYPNRKLSINGDVSIGLGYNNNGVGSNGIEILGGGQVPIRRGISTDDDPNGHFDFFINNWQSANGIAEFRFKNSIVNNGIAANSSLAPDLMKIDGLGRITINNSNTTLTDKAFTIVNNTNPVLPFDYFTVNGDGRTVIKSSNAIPFSLSNDATYAYEFRQSNGNADIWTLTNLFSYGFGIDNTSVGHIWADANQKRKVINFKNFGVAQVWIGDLQPTGTHSNYRLAVDGKLVAKEIVVTQLSWADYVFSENYKLNSLEYVGKYIKDNKHLPNVPSAKEIETNGLSLAEISKLQMEKIEELTLYMIELKKEVDALKQKINK